MQPPIAVPTITFGGAAIAYTRRRPRSRMRGASRRCASTMWRPAMVTNCRREKPTVFAPALPQLVGMG
jgi:hypothetical protein